MSNEWMKMGACDMGRAIEEGVIDPVELTEAFIAAIKDHPFGATIFARVTEERGRAEAKASAIRARSGLRHSILDGVPISWKDLFDSAGVVTEAGSNILAGRIPSKDAEVLRRASELGTICLGKTHLSELAFSGLGLNPVKATPPCVNDHEAVSGGSSSGAAASVAFELAAAAVGSDTGGSVRIPAAWNDLVGLKTTSGVLPLDGVVPLCPKFDTIGPLARSVEDAAALFAILNGQSQSPILAGESLKKLRFFIVDEGLEKIQEEPRKGFELAIDSLGKAGAKIGNISIPLLAKAQSLAACLYCVEAHGYWKDQIDAHPDRMFFPIRERFQAGQNYSGVEYVQAWRQVTEMRREYLALTRDVDAVLLPACLIMPPNKSRVLSDAEYHVQENLLALTNTRIGNLMEVPALTLPTGVPSTGLMILGRPRAEARLLRIGSLIERVLHQG